jgi:predicted glycosyltransferase
MGKTSWQLRKVVPFLNNTQLQICDTESMLQHSTKTIEIVPDELVVPQATEQFVRRAGANTINYRPFALLYGSQLSREVNILHENSQISIFSCEIMSVNDDNIGVGRAL